MGIKTINISFVVITWNGLHYLQRLLASMEEQMERAEAEIIVVDNGSTDGTAEYIQSHYPAIQLIALTENRGVAAARNIGLSASKGRYLLILDNDIIINNEAIDGMKNYMTSHPKTGLCACQLRYANGDVQTSYKDFPGITVKVNNMLHHHQSLTQKHPIYVIGACQMIRRETYQQIGPLDEHIFYGPEDCDYCMRVQQKGWEVTYLSQYSLIHNCQRLTTKHPFSQLGMKHIKGLLYFYWKYKRIF